MTKFPCNLEQQVKNNILIKKLRKQINRFHSLSEHFLKNKDHLYSGEEIAHKIKELLKDKDFQ